MFRLEGLFVCRVNFSMIVASILFNSRQYVLYQSLSVHVATFFVKRATIVNYQCKSVGFKCLVFL